MRLFLAIELPKETTKQLDEQLAPLHKKYPGFSWVTPENFHITIHFFGETHMEKEIAQRVRDLIYDIESFQMYSFELDTFVRHNILLYLGFRRQKTLENLADRIREDLKLPPKKFVPHLTISRSALSSKQQYFALKNMISKMKIDIEFNVDKIYLFQSILTGKTPVYEKVEEFKLL